MINELSSVKIDPNVETDIVKFTDNNYDAFCFNYKTTLDDKNGYCSQYYCISNNIIYIISISTNREEFLQSSEIKNILNSFTFKNFKPIKLEFTFMTCLAILTFFIGLVYYFVLLKKIIKLNIEIKGKVIVSIMLVIFQIILTTREWRELIFIYYIPDFAYFVGHLVLLWIAISLLSMVLPSAKSKNKKIKQNDEIHKEIIEKNNIKKQDKIYCTNCGKEIDEEWKFCKNCGKEIK